MLLRCGSRGVSDGGGGRRGKVGCLPAPAKSGFGGNGRGRRMGGSSAAGIGLVSAAANRENPAPSAFGRPGV